MMFLVSATALIASANEKASDEGQSIKDYIEKLNTMPYEEYMALYFDAETPVATETIEFDATTAWYFTDSKGRDYTLVNNTWTMTEYGSEGEVKNTYTSADGVHFTAADGTEVSIEGTTLASVKEYDGVQAVYTPNTGAVTWKIDFSDYGVTTPALYSIELHYYPVEGKAAAIEREFYINGDAPFSEARSLELSKNWASKYSDKVSNLFALYKLGSKDVLADIEAEAIAAGIKYTVADDLASIKFEQPAKVTSASNAFISKYKLRFFIVDADNNELRPSMVQAPKWMNYTMSDSEGAYSNDFGFYLDPTKNGGVMEFTLDGVNEAVAISKIVLKPYKEVQSYNDYRTAIKNAVTDEGLDKDGTDSIQLEAEYTSNASTNVVYPVEDRTSPLTSPADTTKIVLNTIGTEKWQTAGQWVEYSFSLANGASGWYEIYSRFKQSYLDGMYVSRSLQIYTALTEEEYVAKFGDTAGYYNGVPFAEAGKLCYDYSTDWQVTNLSAGFSNAEGTGDETYQIFFREGVEYTIRLEVTLGSMSSLVQQIEDVLNALNNDYLTIIKLTGASPDDYRDYNFSRLLPDTLVDMLVQADELGKISEALKSDSGVASTYTGVCDKLKDLLEDMARDEENLAKNLSTFKSYVGSLGTFLTDAKTQPLQLDYMSIQPATADAPKGNANFFQSFVHELKSFIQSFFRDYNNMGSMDDSNSNNTESLNVWLAYGRDQSQVIRNLSTNNFTPATGISVDLKLVSGGTLLPSILAGMGPDVYLGLDQATIINYAIRGALSNIENLEYDTVEEFEQAMSVNFTDAAMTVLGIADADGDKHYYGLPETQGFNMMFVRLDILADLAIDIPSTWEDIYVAQSKLESNNMSIGVTTDYQMFLYQTGGDLWADGGMRINLDSTGGLQAFNKMCNMFTMYSFPYSYDAANRFRTGEMPIIIAGYTGLYNQLKVFATEIEGCWTFVPLPSSTYVKDYQTHTSNVAISSVSAVVMISDTESPEAAWKYMKWYTGAEAQTEYANEMVAIIGDSAKHATANRTALASMPWTVAEYAEVSKQFENLASVNNFPGYYYIGRYTDFAFMSAYNDDADPSSELLSYINTINNEITRKREEFKLETLEIGQTLADKRMEQAERAMALLTERYGEETYATALLTAKRGIANEKIEQIDEAAELFTEILLSKWEADGKKMGTYTKVNGQVLDVPSYYKNVSKQTAEQKNGGYNIEDLNEQQLLYFIAECLRNTADALESYQ